MGHPLQSVFETAAGEQAYGAEIAHLIEADRLSDAEAKLTADLALLDTPVAQMCRAMTLDTIAVEGWPEMMSALAQYEGDPVGAFHIVLANEADLAFSPKGLYDPQIFVGFYANACFPFVGSSREAILAELQAETPAWFGNTEDIESYFEVSGFAEINTALLRHKTQFHFRPAEGEPPAEVPVDYVEFVLASSFRALRFHQAVKALLDEQGIPGNIPVIVGMENMRPEIASVYLPKIELAANDAETASLVIPMKPRAAQDVVELPTGSSIRRKLLEAPAEDDEPEAPRGFLSRILRRA